MGNGLTDLCDGCVFAFLSPVSLSLFLFMQPRRHLPNDIQRIVSTLATIDEDWRARTKAIHALGVSVQRLACNGLCASLTRHDLLGWQTMCEKNPDRFTHDVLKALADPLETQIKDLRSAIVREACGTIKTMANLLGDGFKPVALVLLPTLIEMSGGGNKVRSPNKKTRGSV